MELQLNRSIQIYRIACVPTPQHHWCHWIFSNAITSCNEYREEPGRCWQRGSVDHSHAITSHRLLVPLPKEEQRIGTRQIADVQSLVDLRLAAGQSYLIYVLYNQQNRLVSYPLHRRPATYCAVWWLLLSARTSQRRSISEENRLDLKWEGDEDYYYDIV